MTVANGTPYDENNIFARILRGEIPTNKLFENEYALAFPDISPQAAVHVLVIPKGPYVSLADFSAKAPAELVAGFWNAVGEVARVLNLEEGGYRILSNAGTHSGQEVPHLHVHILAGQQMGPLLPR